MEKKKIEIEYFEYSSLDELSQQDRSLVKKAEKAQKNSYAPYSKFNVGAAVLLEDGKVVTGSNQENAASPSGLCAERTAFFAAGHMYPKTPIVAIAIAGGPEYTICDDPATPCGACLQVMAEYQKIHSNKIAVIMYGAKKIWKFTKVDDMLPMIFTSLD